MFFLSGTPSRRGSTSSGAGLSQDEFLDILHSFIPRCFPGESRQQALRTFVLRHGLNRLSHYAGKLASTMANTNLTLRMSLTHLHCGGPT